MTPENTNSDQENVKPSAEELSSNTNQENTGEVPAQEPLLQAQEKPLKDSGPQTDATAAESTSTQTTDAEDTNEETTDSETTDSEKANPSASEDNTDEEEKENHSEHDTEHESLTEELKGMSLAKLFEKMEQIINSKNAGADYKKFNLIRDEISKIIHDETEEKKHEFTEAGNPEEDFSFEHLGKAKLSGMQSIFKEKHDEYHKQQEEEQNKNLEQRQSIIERLKNLYTNSEAGTNFFKEIREIKDLWSNAGQVPKAEFKLLNNNYFHHLNQFYQMLDLNKEYLEQEYAHNLEKREHIIARAKELESEPSVQKALNELQYLHKLWREEAEPVAEEFREKTWQEFREISNKIHERKAELNAQLEAEQAENLEKKNSIIEEIKKLITPEKEPNHNYWQNAIKKVEELRLQFLKTGSVPRKISNQNWNDFKQTLRSFNNKKNEFYKGLKSSHQKNLEEKLNLISIAKENMSSEDWETAVPLFKKLQEDWKKIGHVPRSLTNKVWDDFREACNTFFQNYREKNDVATDNWKDNYKRKRTLLDELKQVTDEEGSVEKIEQLKTAWNNIGKVPRDKISINSEFNKTLREKLKLNKIHDYELKEEGLSEDQITDKARKIKNQISDLEAEIVKLENNLGFFHNPTRENPLLKDTYDTIDEKKSQLEAMKQSLHHIISGE